MNGNLLDLFEFYCPIIGGIIVLMLVGVLSFAFKQPELPTPIRYDVPTYDASIEGEVYYYKLANFIYDEEGGYANYKEDNGGETNRGVTWDTFLVLSEKLKYTPTKQLFMQMPKRLWYCIYNDFWEYTHADSINNPKVRLMLVDFSWGSGPYSCLSTTASCLRRMGYTITKVSSFSDLTFYINQCDSEELFSLLMQKRVQYCKSTHPKFHVGLLNRLQRFKKLLNHI